MREYHPFEPFIPENCKYLLTGSFPGKIVTQQDPGENWQYAGKQNQFWKILENVYQCSLQSTSEKQKLLSDLKIGLIDIIYSCIRKNNRNTDMNLSYKIYNTANFEKVFKNYPINTLFFTGKGVYNEFCKHFRYPENVQLVVLPSPSPLYAAMRISEKIARYQQLLPQAFISSNKE